MWHQMESSMTQEKYKHKLVKLKDIEYLKKAATNKEGEHTTFLFKDWLEEVNAGNTRLGYWEWVYESLHSV